MALRLDLHRWPWHGFWNDRRWHHHRPRWRNHHRTGTWTGRSRWRRWQDFLGWRWWLIWRRWRYLLHLRWYLQYLVPFFFGLLLCKGHAPRHHLFSIGTRLLWFLWFGLRFFLAPHFRGFLKNLLHGSIKGQKIGQLWLRHGLLRSQHVLQSQLL